MIVKPPIAEHIRKDMVQEISGLLRKARFAPRGNGEPGERKEAPGPEAMASYREALGLAAKLVDTATPKQLFMLLDMLGKFPHGDFGGEGEGICETLKDSLLRQYRSKVFAITGWVSQ